MNQIVERRLRAQVICAQAKTALIGDKAYGRTNNALIEFAHLLEFAASHPAPNVTVVVVPEVIKKSFPPHLFDWGPLASWVCIAQDGPPPGTLALHESMRDIFYWNQRGHYGAKQPSPCPACVPRTVNGTGHPLPWVDYRWLHGTVFAQLLLRARDPLRAEVDAIIRKHGPHYVAIHLRQLEGECPKRVRREHVRITREDLGREVTHEDICQVSDQYLAAALAKDRVPREWPIIILHDGQPLSVARVPQLIERFGAVDVRGTPLVAMLLLAKSSYLVGNPASTFSINMADIRRASGAAEASTTLRYGHY